MSDLPADRIQPGDPPFTYTGTDCFGPLYVKKGRGSAKRYGCLFTCLNTRAVHIEVLHSLDSSSFINRFQRFTARTGMPKLMRSDNATNFRGAEREIRKALEQVSKEQKTREILLKNEVQWIFNTPAASHHGGVWERQIRSIRKVLLGVSGGRLFMMDDEQLMTFLCIVESTINSRPITRNPNDVSDSEALTPHHILMLRRGPPVMGTFEKADLYGRRWKQIQWLASVFWRRWLKEYIPNLQIRSRWAEIQRNLKVDDLVLILDEQKPRSLWPLGRILEAIRGRDGLVQTVKIKIGQTVFDLSNY